MIGSIFAVLSAATFGLVGPFTRRGLISGSASQAVYVTVIMGVPLLLVVSIITRQIFEVSSISTQNYLILASAGIVHYIFGRYCAARSFSALGVNRATPLQALATIISVLVAIGFLGEEFTPILGLGITLIMIGPTILIEPIGKFHLILPGIIRNISRPGFSVLPNFNGYFLKFLAPARLRSVNKEQTPPIQLAEGYLFGILASLAWGISPIMVRFVLTDNNVGVLACTISYAGAASLLVLSLILPGRLTNLQKINTTAVKWFLLSGTSVSIAHLLWFLALGIIPVTIAAPLQYTSPIFSYVVSFLLNRNIESFGPKIILAISLSVIGSMILGLAYI